MATTLYLRNAAIGIATYGADTLMMTRGATADTLSVNTTQGGTWRSIGYFSTRPLVGFTLAQSVSINLRGLESAAQANASLGIRLFKWTRTGGLGSQIIQIASGTELTTSEAARTASGTPSSTTFAAGDVLVAEVGAVNVGTMGAGQSVTLYFNGPTASASGDSYITLTDDVIVHRRIYTAG